MAQNNRPRTSVDAKAKSRQQSRSVGTSKRRPSSQAKKGAAPKRSRGALYTWAAVAVVVVVVVVLVVVKVTSSKSTVSKSGGGGATSSSVVSEVTHVGKSVFSKVGIGKTAGVNAPKYVATDPVFTITTKPAIFYDGAEFCPYCAAERWSMIIALSRFGSFSGLADWASSSTDTYPSTPTFTFLHATYASQYLVAKLVESEDETHHPLQKLTKQESTLVAKYDTSTQSHPIPFIDIGGKILISGSSYSPQILQGLTRTAIAANLKDATNPVTQAIVGTANYITAAICSITSNAPSSVCSTKGVAAAAAALGI